MSGTSEYPAWLGENGENLLSAEAGPMTTRKASLNTKHMQTLDIAGVFEERDEDVSIPGLISLVSFTTNGDEPEEYI